MVIQELADKWLHLLSEKMDGGFRALRLSAESIQDLFIGENESGKRCFILFLNNDNNLITKEIEKEHISLQISKEKRILLIVLKDAYFNDLFNDLIVSVYNGVGMLNSAEESTKEFVDSFYRWVEFFSDKYERKLSHEQIQGLFGELIVLKKLIIDYSDPDIALNAWKGPFDSAQDFYLENKNIEVKTTGVSSSLIKISSEYQLQVSDLKELELWLVRCRNEAASGQSVLELVNEISELIKLKLGNSNLLYNALFQYRLTIDNLHEYDGIRLKAESIKKYDCLAEGFPKIIHSEIIAGVQEVRYSLKLEVLNPFLIEETKL